MGTLRLLLLEDSENDAILLLMELQCGGYEPVFQRVDNAAAMTTAIEQQSWDVVISNYSVPQFSATAALKLLQEKGLDIPFIIISGSIGENSAVALMKAGAHDFILNFHQYIPDLVQSLSGSYEVNSARIGIKMNIIENIFLSLDIALPCGLILKELILNCLKHVFPVRITSPG